MKVELQLGSVSHKASLEEMQEKRGETLELGLAKGVWKNISHFFSD